MIKREVILRGVQLGVRVLPTGEKAVAIVDQDRGEALMVPMSEENFRALLAQWNGLVVATGVPNEIPAALMEKIQNGGRS